MKEELRQSLFIHDNVESPLYYLTGTIVLSVVIVCLVAIVIYSVISSIKRHKGADYVPKEFRNYDKIDWFHSLLVGLSSTFTFIISISFFPQALVTGWAEDIGMLIFFPFIAAIFFGGIGKASRLKKIPLFHGITFWRTYAFVLIYLALRVVFF